MGQENILKIIFFFIIWITHDIRKINLGFGSSSESMKGALPQKCDSLSFPSICVPQQPQEWNSPEAAHYLRDTIQGPHYSCKALQELATAMSPTSEPTTLASLILLPQLWLLGCSLNMPNPHLPQGLCTYCFLCLEVPALIVLGLLFFFIGPLLKWSLSLTCFIFLFFWVLVLTIYYIFLFICLLSVSPH